MADIIADLELYSDAINVSTLDDQEQEAFNNLNRFWNNSNVYHYEQTLDIDKFYDIKEYHNVLNGRHLCDSTDTVDLLWGCYIQKAMSHRISLTSRAYIPRLSKSNKLSNAIYFVDKLCSKSENAVRNAISILSTRYTSFSTFSSYLLN